MLELEKGQFLKKDKPQTASQSCTLLAKSITALNGPEVQFEIEETKQKISLPLNTLKLLAEISKPTSEGRPVSNSTCKYRVNHPGSSRLHRLLQAPYS
jgi:hypothetical protein